MKFRGAPLDDLYQELQVTLGDGGLVARLLLLVFGLTYRAHRGAMLLALKRRWQHHPTDPRAATGGSR